MLEWIYIKRKEENTDDHYSYEKIHRSDEDVYESVYSTLHDYHTIISNQPFEERPDVNTYIRIY